ncbi:hypothetical protein A2U01_0056470, partial [Trifolium medium]|nr:hypothetical protein [Trifolium medium]
PGPHLKRSRHCHFTVFSTPFLVEFLPSVKIEPRTLGFKYVFNPFLLTLVQVRGSSISSGSGNVLNTYLNPKVRGSIPTEGKNSTRVGVEKIVRWQCRDRLRWGPGLLHNVSP